MAVPAPIAFWKFDEASGNPADATGNGYTLTNNNTVGFGAGALNNCADFGASNTNKTFSTSSTLGLAVNDTRSFAGWVNVTTAPGVYDIMGMGYDANDVFYIFEYINFPPVRLRVGRARNGVDDPTILYTTTLTTGTWFHLAYTFNGSTFAQNLYVNGSNVGSNTATSGNGSGSTTTGTVFSTALFSAARFFQGKCDEWGVWNVELTSSEVTELYNSGTPLAYPFSGGGGSPTARNLMMMGIGS